MTAARATRPRHCSMVAAASSAVVATDTIPPSPAIPAMTRLRNATTAAASSNVNAPATYAAAISPCEWPITADGWTP
ncbi:hypothetical protein B0E53_05956 [Micromonospora sp. MH33]|nr:hypothetical protein B0E53_05956 [Micromonospora sp. MH33]